jgi:isoleucyl-tRNA synthetase
MSRVREIVSLALMKRTEAKIKVRQPLARLTTKVEIGEAYIKTIKEELNVKEITHDTNQVDEAMLDTTITPELQKEGDIRELIRAVQDLRKAKGLIPKDRANLETSLDLDEVTTEAIKSTCSIDEIRVNAGVTGEVISISSGPITLSLL